MFSFAKKLKIIGLLVTAVISSSCLRQGNSSNTKGYEGLAISGKILDTEGKAPSQAMVYVEGLRQPMPTIANGGNYQIQLSEAQLNQIRSNLTNIRAHFYIRGIDIW